MILSRLAKPLPATVVPKVPQYATDPIEVKEISGGLSQLCYGCWGRLSGIACPVGVPVLAVKADPQRETIGFATTTSNPIIIAPTNATLDPTGFVISQGPIVWLKASEASQFAQWEWWANCLGPAIGFVTIYELLKPNW